MYYGEEPEPGESEDECYAALDTQRAYTRSSVERRRQVWEDIEAFEATRTRTLMHARTDTKLCPASARTTPLLHGRCGASSTSVRNHLFVCVYVCLVRYR